LEKLASIIGALLFLTLGVVVVLAFVDYIQSGHEKTVRGGASRRFLPLFHHLRGSLTFAGAGYSLPRRVLFSLLDGWKVVFAQNSLVIREAVAPKGAAQSSPPVRGTAPTSLW